MTFKQSVTYLDSEGGPLDFWAGGGGSPFKLEL